MVIEKLNAVEVATDEGLNIRSVIPSVVASLYVVMMGTELIGDMLTEYVFTGNGSLNTTAYTPADCNVMEATLCGSPSVAPEAYTYDLARVIPTRNHGPSVVPSFTDVYISGRVADALDIMCHAIPVLPPAAPVIHLVWTIPPAALGH